MSVRLPFLVGVILAVTSAASVAFRAERPVMAAQAAAAGSTTLTEAETLGKKMFQQRCSICHSGGTGAAPPYGGVVTSDNLREGRETLVRELIKTGSARMPGFQYTLESREIDSIVLYLKKVPGTGN